MNRLLITNCYAGAGGGEVAILRHLDHSTLPNDRLAVALLNDGPLVQAVRQRRIRCEMIGRRGRDGEFPGIGETYAIAWGLARLIRDTGTTHVMCCTTQDLRAALIAKRLAQFRLIWRSQGELTIFSRSTPPDARAARFIRSARRGVDAVITTTSWDAEALVAWGMPRDRVQTIYYACVDDDWFDAPAQADAREVRRIVMFGRLVEWKGHRTFIDAFARLADGFSALEGWIVGDGDSAYRTELEREVRKRGLEGRIRFLGHRTDIRVILRDADISVHCSEREPFGLVLAEAMATGVPVVAADVEGPREIIQHGVTGFLVPPGASVEYAVAIERLIRDRELRERIARHAYADASARYRASVNVASLESATFAVKALPAAARAAALDRVGSPGRHAPLGHVSPEQVQEIAELNAQLRTVVKDLNVQFQRIAQIQARLDTYAAPVPRSKSATY